MLKGYRYIKLLVFHVLLWSLAGMSPVIASDSLPLVKKADILSAARIPLNIKTPDIPAGMEDDLRAAIETLSQYHIPVQPDGIKIRYRIASADRIVPPKAASESYTLSISPDEIALESPTAAGLFYATQTLVQMIGSDGKLPHCVIRDWPDFPVRMIMLDPARQNETFDYYRRVITFAAHYKINTILLHLTDDQTSALFHPDYPALMHPHAWSEKEARDLKKFAECLHIVLIPEIESFGHARMFTRMPDYADYLHEAIGVKSNRGWYGTDKQGYTNVLCPTSTKAAKYLADMYSTAVRVFEPPYIHIGFDEVDMTTCSKCISAGANNKTEWFRKHLEHSCNMAWQSIPDCAIWGDMLLKDRAIAQTLGREHLIIYDWHYYENVEPETSQYFRDLGFRVIASPALVCSPHVVMPDTHCYNNISKFARIARELNLEGLNTTIWCPTRYMSDVLWTGIAFAATQSWSGSNWNSGRFYSTFARDYFGISDGLEYQAIWEELARLADHNTQIFWGLWMDDEGLAKAAKLAETSKDELTSRVRDLQSVRNKLDALKPKVERHIVEFDTICRSAFIFQYGFEHLLAAPDILEGGEKERKRLKEFQQGGEQAYSFVKADWLCNRYPDDPNLNGIFLCVQHLLFRLKQMNDYHNSLLGKYK